MSAEHDAEAGIKSSIVRVFAVNGTAVGAGVLIEGGYVLTCAHVVAAAIPGTTKTQANCPPSEIKLSCPFTDPSKPIVGRVTVWGPGLLSTPPVTAMADVAVIQLLDAPPLGSASSKLLMATNWAGDPFKVWGATQQNAAGDWVSGRLKGELPDQYVQMYSNTDEELQIYEGYSGAPVWDLELGGIVGTLTQRDERPRISYLLPTRALLRTWPLLPIRFSSNARLTDAEQAALLQFNHLITVVRDESARFRDSVASNASRARTDPQAFTNEAAALIREGRERIDQDCKCSQVALAVTNCFPQWSSEDWRQLFQDAQAQYSAFQLALVDALRNGNLEVALGEAEQRRHACLRRLTKRRDEIVDLASRHAHQTIRH